MGGCRKHGKGELATLWRGRRVDCRILVRFRIPHGGYRRKIADQRCYVARAANRGGGRSLGTITLIYRAGVLGPGSWGAAEREQQVSPITATTRRTSTSVPFVHRTRRRHEAARALGALAAAGAQFRAGEGIAATIRWMANGVDVVRASSFSRDRGVDRSGRAPAAVRNWTGDTGCPDIWIRRASYNSGAETSRVRPIRKRHFRRRNLHRTGDGATFVSIEEGPLNSSDGNPDHYKDSGPTAFKCSGYGVPTGGKTQKCRSGLNGGRTA